MKAAAFAYARATSVVNALELLTAHGDKAKVLSGGQSLMPAMNLRLISPELIVDIGEIAVQACVLIGTQGAADQVFLLFLRHAEGMDEGGYDARFEGASAFADQGDRIIGLPVVGEVFEDRVARHDDDEEPDEGIRRK